MCLDFPPADRKVRLTPWTSVPGPLKAGAHTAVCNNVDILQHLTISGRFNFKNTYLSELCFVYLNFF